MRLIGYTLLLALACALSVLVYRGTGRAELPRAGAADAAPAADVAVSAETQMMTALAELRTAHQNGLDALERQEQPQREKITKAAVRLGAAIGADPKCFALTGMSWWALENAATAQGCAERKALWTWPMPQQQPQQPAAPPPGATATKPPEPPAKKGKE